MNDITVRTAAMNNSNKPSVCKFNTSKNILVCKRKNKDII